MKKKALLFLVAPFLVTGCITQTVITEHAMAHKNSTIVKPDVDDFPFLPKYKTESVPGQPAYYALVPFTVAADVATLPVQLPIAVYVLLFHRAP